MFKKKGFFFYFYLFYSIIRVVHKTEGLLVQLLDQGFVGDRHKLLVARLKNPSEGSGVQRHSAESARLSGSHLRFIFHKTLYWDQ